MLLLSILIPFLWGLVLLALPEIKNSPIPIIANGDIKTSDDLKMAESLGYSGAMVGRGLMGKPWVLSEIMGGAAPENSSCFRAPRSNGNILHRNAPASTGSLHIRLLKDSCL